MGLNIQIDNTLSHFAATWITNAIRNGRKNVPDLAELQTYLKAVRAIICGTGPTLNLALDRLKQISETEEGETLIIANHSNLATLLYHNINPDIVVIADSGDPTFKRLERDVLPNFKAQLRKRHTKFILPTHANVNLVDLLLKHRCPVYFYLSVIPQKQDDMFAQLYNTVLEESSPNAKNKTCVMQAGSVANASVILMQALKNFGKAPELHDVFLAGVDYSYPGGITRCEQVTYNQQTKDFDVDHLPTFLGEEIRKVKINGLLTSEEQIEYYKDLRFIYWNMIEAAGDDAPFELFTANANFISDFLPMRSL